MIIIKNRYFFIGKITYFKILKLKSVIYEYLLEEGLFGEEFEELKLSFGFRFLVPKLEKPTRFQYVVFKR